MNLANAKVKNYVSRFGNCAGELKKKLYLRSGSQRKRFCRFLTCPSKNRHGTTLFTVIPRNRPIYSPVTTRWGYGGLILIFIPGVPTGVLCLENVLFCVIYWNIASKSKTHKACVCCQHAKHDQTFYLIWYLHVESKHKPCASFCYLYNIDVFKYEIQNSSFTR